MFVKALIFSFFFLVGTSSVSAHYSDHYDWIQTAFGSGIKSIVTISSTTVSQTGGSYGHLCGVTPVSNANPNFTFIQRQSGTFTVNNDDLSPSQLYLIVKTNTSSLNTSPCTAVMGQMVDDYPYEAGGFYGHVFFKTDSEGRISCWSTKRTKTSNEPDFLQCENIYDYTVLTNTIYVLSSTSSSSTSSTIDFSLWYYIVGIFLFFAGIRTWFVITNKLS